MINKYQSWKVSVKSFLELLFISILLFDVLVQIINTKHRL